MNSIQDFRSFYAKFMVASSGSSDEELIAAFASVERERFVGTGPWSVHVGGKDRYLSTGTDDPRILYQDVLIGLATERGINNGQPSLHAKCLASVKPLAGERVVHVGAGTGYYTAILASLVGPSGSVTAYEIEQDLADRASANLRDFPNVQVHCASALDARLPVNTQVIYVNAGATHPVGRWLDALALNGRLIFPLTSNDSWGVMLLVTRRSANSYAANVVDPVGFINCIGARDYAASETLAAALKRGNAGDIRSLHRNSAPDSTAWCVGSGWWLSTAEAV
jgi:protein-L-isoaspartate(D-aspartate) O-methyltransferase